MRRFGEVLIGLAVLRAGLGALTVLVFNPEQRMSSVICLGALALAQATDHFDGWLARSYSNPSTAGYLQDSVADKLFHFGCLLALTRYYDWTGLLVWAVCAREVMVLGARVVVGDVATMLRRFRVYSIVYATLLRTAILAFFAMPFVPDSLPRSIIIPYALLSLASAIGLINVVVLFRGMATISNQRP